MKKLGLFLDQEERTGPGGYVKESTGHQSLSEGKVRNKARKWSIKCGFCTRGDEKF